MQIGSLVKVLKSIKGTVHTKEIKGCLGVVVDTHYAPMGHTVYHIKLIDGRMCFCGSFDMEVM